MTQTLIRMEGHGGLYATDAHPSLFLGDGTTDERSALNTLLSTTMPATGGRILLGLGTHLIGSNITITKELIIPEGATLKPASGVTITLDFAPQAGRYQIFDLSAGGLIAFSADRPVSPMPEWYGAVADNSTDCAAAIAAAAAAAGAQIIEVVNEYGTLPEVDLGEGRYAVASTVTITKPVVIRGKGRGATTIVGSADDDIIEFDIDKEAAWSSAETLAPGLRDLTVTGSESGTSQNGVKVTAGNTRAWLHLDNVGIQSCGNRGITVDTAVSMRLHRCVLYGNAAQGAYFGGTHNTDLRITESIIRRNMIGVEFAASEAYSIWVRGCLIEDNTQGSGDPGSATRPCVGIQISGASSSRQIWIDDCYFEGHLNDVYATTLIKVLYARGNYHAINAGAEAIIALGTLQRQFGAYYLTSASNDALHLENCFISQPTKPALTSDADWGTDNTKTTTTGSITTGTPDLTVASMQGIHVGAKLSIAGVTGTFLVTAIQEQFDTSGARSVTLDGNADATVSGATVTVHWGQTYEHVRLIGRSCMVRDCLYLDTASGRYAPIITYEDHGGGNLHMSFAGTGSVGEFRLSGPTTVNIEAWNRLRFASNEFLSESLRAYIASTNCNVGTSGEHRFIAASKDSTVSGTINAIIASDGCETSGERSTIISSLLCESAENRAVVLGGRRVIPGSGAAITTGYAGSGDPLTANRTFEVEASLGNVTAKGSFSGSTTYTDYAEYFENAEKGVIPLGTIVALDGEKVRPWDGSDPILGVVSGTAGVVLGDSPFSWSGRYLTGEFGEPLYDVVDGEKVYRENPAWDPSLPQVPRSERPEEWSCVGLLGQVHVRVSEEIRPGDFLDHEDRLRVMRITQAYDEDKGYAVAKCLLR